MWQASSCLAPVSLDPMRRRRPPRRTVSIAVVLLVLVGGTQAAWGYERGRASHLLPATTIGGIRVGGLEASVAASRLRDAIEAPLHRPLAVRGADAAFVTTPWKAGLRVDVTRAVAAALSDERSVDPIRRLWRRLTGGGRTFDLAPAVDPAEVRAFVDRSAVKIDRPVQELDVRLVDGFLKVKPARTGRTLDQGKAEGAVADALRSEADRVTLPVKVTKLAGENVNTAILVRTDENKLYFYRDGKVAKTYRVATGTYRYATPTGSFRIVNKRRNPGWGNPNQPWSAGMPAYIAPGPGNPLGTRALDLSIGGIRIHGTYEAGSIGSHASHGCIRMHIKESEELFEKVPVGTPVVIVRA
jgi:lipoprotein-anchoring transpeptidase ErfK/SrfK